MIGAEVNRWDGWRDEEGLTRRAHGERGGEQRGLRCRWKVAADLGEQSNSDRKFLYGVRRAAHSQLEARN